MLPHPNETEHIRRKRQEAPGMSDVIKQQIRDLLEQHNAVLLAHNYMRDEVQ